MFPMFNFISNVEVLFHSLIKLTWCLFILPQAYLLKRLITDEILNSFHQIWGNFGEKFADNQKQL